MYDYLIVGAGLFGSVFARQMTDSGFRCLVIDKKNHIAGHCYTEDEDGITIHSYGAHIFHTDDEYIWNYVQRFAKWLPYRHRVKVNAKGRLFNFPINFNTLRELWGIKDISEAQERLQKARYPVEGDSIESWALSQYGLEIYETFIKGYTFKQWGRPPSQIPASILKRIPIRFDNDDSYFNDRFQGIPEGGYTYMVLRMLERVEVKLGCNYLNNRIELKSKARKIVYSAPIDELFNCNLGRLEYRSLRFEKVRLDVNNFQGFSVVNYVDKDVPWTRIIEHKHFTGIDTPNTIVTYEYPRDFNETNDPYYPINDEKNNQLAIQYLKRAEQEGYIVGGRLGLYRYYNMDEVISNSISLATKELEKSSDNIS